MQTQAEVSRDQLALLVDRFYDAVRIDPVLGPVFAASVTDWPGHKARLVCFWASVVLGEGSYRGSPMAAHRAAPGILRGHFAGWLALWKETCEALLDPPAASYLHALATRMGENLARAIPGEGAPRVLPASIAGGYRPD